MKLKLHWQIFIALSIGILAGFLSRPLGLQFFVTEQLSVFGTIFLRCLRMVIIPLIFSSIVSGVTGISSAESFGRLSLKTFVYYISTSLIAILTGLFLVNLFQPGVKPGLKEQLGFEQLPEEFEANVDKLGDTLLGIIPTNPIAAMAKGDVLPVIFFALLFGFFITRSPEPYRKMLTDFFQGIFTVMMQITQFIIRFTPVGVFALVAKIVAQTGSEIFGPLGNYMLVVFSGLVIHAFFSLPLLMFIFARVHPLKQFQAMSAALMTAFSTASSSATLPLTMDAMENKAGVSNRICSFVLPLGSTVNMDGTALYECVAVMFIAQVYGFDLSLAQQFIVVLMALLVSIGAAGIPMAGLVMMTIILRAVNLPLEGVGLILAVDRILDMMRTSVNVWSDACGAAIIARSEGENGLKVLISSKAH
ncbi:MAG: sodium:dicarboxylate symporter [Caldithrix sp. RBG_13_44_9]|nr:MAG: sodium:dicarboxylate symporter [Caldithrix sp. RBG_13_44_9]